MGVETLFETNSQIIQEKNYSKVERKLEEDKANVLSGSYLGNLDKSYNRNSFYYSCKFFESVKLCQNKKAKQKTTVLAGMASWGKCSLFFTLVPGFVLWPQVCNSSWPFCSLCGERPYASFHRCKSER
jgi:hypothetical protein